MTESQQPTQQAAAPAPSSAPPDPDAYDSPRAVQARARGLAAPYIAGGEDPDLAATQRGERRYLRWLIAMVAVVVLAGFVLGAIAKLVEDALGGATPAATPAAVAPAANVTSEAPTAGPPSPEPSAPPLGAVVDGVPTTLDSVPVIRGTAVLAAATGSTDATPFLIGGWFHGVVDGRFCTFIHPPRPVDACGWGFDLFVASNTKLGLLLAQGTNGKPTFLLAGTTIRPVVLRVHTHDPLCVGEFKFCRSTVVLDKVAWLGTAMGELPSAPVEAPPPTSFSRHDAIAKARRHIASAYALRSVAVVRETTAMGILQGPVADDPWVWSLKFRIPGTNDTADIVFDYLTGKEIMRGYGRGP